MPRERRFPLAAGRQHSGDPQQDEIWRQIRQIIDYLQNHQLEVPGELNELLQSDGDGGFLALEIGAEDQALQVVDGVPTWADLPPGVPYQEIDIAANVETASTVYTRAGALTLNMADFPDVTSVVFKATIETSLATSAYYAEVRLFDITNNVAVTGTTMDNSALGSAARATATEFTSAALTVGSASGNLRNDAATVYAVQFRVNGTVSDTSTQWAILSNARLKVVSA